jgi:hypothetical protein
MSEGRETIQPDGLVMPYNISIYPYFTLMKDGRIQRIDDETAIVSRDFLMELLIPMLRRIKFDPIFYRQRYQDLLEAESKGLIADLHDHYLNFGFFENRIPCFVEVDGTFYAREYPDVAVAILENRVASAQTHFETAGFVEGRLPRKGWTFADLLEG